MHDDVEQKLVGKSVHETAVGQVGGLCRERGGRCSVTATAIAVTGRAVANVQFATRLDAATVGARPSGSDTGGQRDPDEVAAGGRRADESEEDDAPPHVTP